MKTGSARITLAAMTVAGSVILVDQTAVPLATPHIIRGLGGPLADGQWILTANLLPLAAFMVLGGRLGDLFGLRRMFLAGAAGFLLATVLAAAAQDMAMLIAARLVQGTAAALMMPNSIAIVSAVFPSERRGSALGILAGGTAFFAALGPVVGGALTGIDWRLVFVLNGLLTLVVIGLTLRGTPDLPARARARIDLPGLVLFTVGIASFVFGLSQLAERDASAASQFGPIALGVVVLAAFVVVELRTDAPLIDLRLLRRPNFLASNVSQVLAGAVELGLGFLLPFQLLLVVGVEPAVAGLALLPASLPIIFAGPLAGRAYDRFGGRWPLVVGFLILAASGVALAAGVGAQSVGALIPGLLLQGLGLGIVLTVNDPVGLGAVPAGAAGEGAGMINTAEQLGGALGVAGFLALEFNFYEDRLYDRLGNRGIDPTQAQVETGRNYLQRVEESGLHNVPEPQVLKGVLHDITAAHVDGFQLAFGASAVVGLVGAVVCFVLVRHGEPLGIRIRSRRSRWVLAGREAP
jgi:EmrB/QacA subfamily drug resistance transporter